MVPISIKKDVFEPNNNNLKFMVRNCSHFCINQIPYLHPIKMHLHIFHNFHWSMSLLCKKLCNLINSVQFSRSVISVSLRPHESSTPGLPVHHQLPELTQTHVHRVSDAIQPSHPLSSPFTNSQSLLKLMSIESVMPSNHLILYHPLLLPPPIFPSIRVFSNKSVLHIRWPKYWEFQLHHQSFQWIFRTDFL